MNSVQVRNSPNTILQTGLQARSNTSARACVCVCARVWRGFTIEIIVDTPSHSNSAGVQYPLYMWSDKINRVK